VALRRTVVEALVEAASQVRTPRIVEEILLVTADGEGEEQTVIHMMVMVGISPPLPGEEDVVEVEVEVAVAVDLNYDRMLRFLSF
jgi:hypothetical protein